MIPDDQSEHPYYGCGTILAALLLLVVAVAVIVIAISVVLTAI